MQYKHYHNGRIIFTFDKTDHWTIEEALTVVVHVHETFESIVAAFFEKPESWLANNMDTAHRCSGRTVRDILAMRDEYLSWGWCPISGSALPIIRMWYSRNAGIETIVSDVTEMLAHEQGHLHGIPMPTHEEEEVRAQAYGRIATLAAKMAECIVIENEYANVATGDLLFMLKNGASLIHDDCESAIQAHSESLIGVLRELRRRLGVV